MKSSRKIDQQNFLLKNFLESMKIISDRSKINLTNNPETSPGTRGKIHERKTFSIVGISIEISDHVIQLPDRMLKCGKMESNEKFIRVQPAKCSAVTTMITV